MPEGIGYHGPADRQNIERERENLTITKTSLKSENIGALQHCKLLT